LVFFEPSFSNAEIARLRDRDLGGDLGGDGADPSLYVLERVVGMI